MCGIAGFVDLEGFNSNYAKEVGNAMGKAIQHRGPDNSGLWVDRDNGVTLAHQRLAIIDLSTSALQPMHSSSGRYVICFNGEIYNHKDLRSELDLSGKSPLWRSYSDTETILACIDAYGLRETLVKLVGMFSIALWDKSAKEIILARDRTGEKPLYYGINKRLLLFGSELKALRAHPKFKPKIDRDALCLYLRHNYIPQPYSIYEGIKKLPPGHFIKLKENAVPEQYWSLKQNITSAKLNPFEGSEKEALNVLDKLLISTVKGQMQADVPLGAFLSGGVDSSLILALMQEQNSHPIESFTIGFDDKEFNEAPYGQEVAKYLGTKHNELYVSSKTAREVIPNLPKIYDEPFSDSSQIPTFLVSEMAQKKVKVCLSGDGGDEVFGGYNRYTWGNNFLSMQVNIPKPFRTFVASLITSLPPSIWNKLLAPALYLTPKKYRYTNIGDKLHKIATIFNCSSFEEVYRLLISHWNFPENVVIGGKEPKTILTSTGEMPNKISNEERMMFYDMMMYLPDDILVKVDRAAMAVSLETRAPFLDHRVIDLASQLPLDMKIRNGTNKWCLKQLLYKRVPKHLIERPKMGFGVPIGDWLRGPLRDWAEFLLAEKRIVQSGYFHNSEIQKKWREHLTGDRNWHYYLWDILMFESWREEEGL